MSTATLFDPCARLSQKLALYFAVALGFAIPISTSLATICTLATVVFVLLSGHYREKLLLIRYSPVALVSLIIFALFTLSLTYTVAPWSYAIHMLFKFSKYLFLAVLLPCFMLPVMRRLGLYSFIAGSGVVLLFSYLKFLGVVHLGPAGMPNAPFNDYIQTSFILTLLGFFMLHFAVQVKKWRWLFASVALLSIINVYFLSDGRTGYVVMTGAWVLFFVQYLRWKGLWVGLLSVAVLCAAAYWGSPYFKMRVQAAISNTEQYQGDTSVTSVGLRYSFYRDALLIIKENPILGSGVGSVHKEYSNVGADIPVAVQNPHDEYLNMTIQLGAVGLLCLFALFYFFLRTSFQLPRHYKFCAQGLLVVIMLGSLANSWLMDTMEGHTFMYLAAVFFANAAAIRAKLIPDTEGKKHEDWSH